MEGKMNKEVDFEMLPGNLTPKKAKSEEEEKKTPVQQGERDRERDRESRNDNKMGGTGRGIQENKREVGENMIYLLAAKCMQLVCTHIMVALYSAPACLPGCSIHLCTKRKTPSLW